MNSYLRVGNVLLSGSPLQSFVIGGDVSVVRLGLLKLNVASLFLFLFSQRWMSSSGEIRLVPPALQQITRLRFKVAQLLQHRKQVVSVFTHVDARRLEVFNIESRSLLVKQQAAGQAFHVFIVQLDQF